MVRMTRLYHARYNLYVNKTIGDIQIAVTNRDLEMSRLVQVSVSTDDANERAAAKKKLHELAASYRGFPGQRRRGDLPAGVEVR